jgi:ankyrin repeat protein
MSNNFNDAAATQKPAPEELVRAAESNDFFDVQDLLARGADVNETDDDGNTALMYASTNVNLRMMRLLIDAGADLEAWSDNQNNALMIAVYSQDPAPVRLLVESGATVSDQVFGIAMVFRDGAYDVLDILERAPEIHRQALAEKEATRISDLHGASERKQENLRVHAPKLIIKRV